MKKYSLSKLALACLCALALVYCFRTCVQTLHFGQDSVVVRVVRGNEVNGATEVWIAENTKKYDVADYSATGGGVCEYRRAADYGYSANMLVSYGENVGMEITFPHWSEQNYQLDLYMQSYGGVIEVTYGGKTREISLYAETAVVQPIVLDTSGFSDDKWLALSLALVILLTLLGYRMLRNMRLTEPAEPLPPGRKSEKTRSGSIDLVRSLAAFLMCFVHIFKGEYYARPMLGGTMLVFTCLRWIAYLCVPLYMLLTGYLCVNRTDVKKTYSRILPLLAQILVLTSLTTLLMGRGRPLSTLRDFLWYSFGGGTNWYVQMYVGLLLLMPFLNLLWKALSKQQRQALLLALFFISTVRSYSEHFFYAYWQGLYPITYYFLGAYLREYKLRLRTGTVAGLFAAIILLFACMTFMHTSVGVFSWTQFGGFEMEYNAFPAMLASALLFTLVSRIKIQKSLLLSMIGRNTLGVYLLEVMVKGRLLSFMDGWLTLSLGSLPLWALYAAAACLIGAALSEVVSVALRLLTSGAQKMLAKVRGGVHHPD